MLEDHTMKPTNNRKNEHVSLAEKFAKETRKSDFDSFRFVHHSFPEMSVADASISTSFAGLEMASPFYINAMTGGSTWTKKVNEKLALIARETGIAMATGSISAALKDHSVEDSYTIVREVNPNGMVFANLGTGQTLENAKKAVDLIQADALQIHVNSPQEIVMPEGDRDFSNWLTELENIVHHLAVPVIVKEVGFGMSRETIQQLTSIGVKTIDISGQGGTNFAQIENYRRTTEKFDYLEDWGQSTVISLVEAQPFINEIDLLASGGIRNPLDIVKALSLGAKGVGISGLFLHMALRDGVEATILEVNAWKNQIASIMTLLGKKSIKDLSQADIILLGEVKDWCELRKIDASIFANRSSQH